MTPAASLRAAYVPPAVNQSIRARVARWIEILRRSRSPRLTYLSARYHASDPVLTVLQSGAKIELRSVDIRFEYENADFVFDPEILPAIDLASDMIDAGYGLHLTGAEWRIDVPDGPSFLVQRESLVSDLAVIGLRFLRREYGFFDVSGCRVLDIGANIGDSALYFLSAGATHITAFEPFGANVARARANISLNREYGRISLHHCGVAGHADNRTFQYEGKIAAGLSTVRDATVRAGRQGMESIRFISFSDAVKEALEKGAGPLVCKMDCEGSEFEIFGEDPHISDALVQVDRMLIEYHWKDPAPLLKRLRDVGFDVETLPLQPGVGLILAQRPD